MRIVGGTHRGRRLFVPKGLMIRPTADRVKEAIFNVLGPWIEGKSVLDLFAGSGSLGLEALSRGAREVVFVDNHPQSLAAIKRNIETLGLGDRARLMRLDLTRGPGRLAERADAFSLFFLDPPYGQNLAGHALNLIERNGLVDPEAVAVVEHSRRDSLDALDESAWFLERERKYGQTKVSFLIPRVSSGE